MRSANTRSGASQALRGREVGPADFGALPQLRVRAMVRFGAWVSIQSIFLARKKGVSQECL